ncbi:hypothetical protein SAMN06265222_103247 [Neorhodopirellula lusitana]|uniref:Uncharacterized protein n=1 Tax=Neorhodopirellula lusitana TaxID=445327 RepID=A0ABY1PWJ1_9BACT|nr:hypothetical protein [Neorhodopirellula lusitana]SMP51223.1 hypothetical protein SAMN06265222_103247 [Neorhodopirellula lusitana]
MPLHLAVEAVEIAFETDILKILVTSVSFNFRRFGQDYWGELIG